MEVVFDPVVYEDGYTYRLTVAADEMPPSLVTKDNFYLIGVSTGNEMEIENAYYDMKTLNIILEVVPSSVYDSQYIVKFDNGVENKKAIGNIEAYSPAQYDTLSIAQVKFIGNLADITVENATYSNRNITVYLKDKQANTLLSSQAVVKAEDTAVLTFDLNGIVIPRDEFEWSVEYS